ncbi:uncharacterized protein [Branchiostoma lanceolatum]|uniref:uncharacterized protein n=1 Tax=Branchiostoma lanceolatum TaxID=7740 RepID=UPI003453891B
MIPLSSLVRVERVEEEAEEAFTKRRRTRCLMIIGTVTLFTAGIIVMSRVSMIAGQIIVCFTALLVFFVGVFSCCLSVNKTCRRNNDRESRIAAVCPQDMQDALPGTVMPRIEPASSNPTPQTTLPPYTSREDLPQYEEAPPYHELPPIVGYPGPQPRYPQDPGEYHNRSTCVYPAGVTTEGYQPPPSYEEAVNSAK